MVGALIETEARRLRDEAAREVAEKYAKETALRLLKRGKLTVAEIAEDTGLSISEVKHLKNTQPV